MHLLHNHGPLDSDNVMVTRKTSGLGTTISPVFVKQQMAAAEVLSDEGLIPRILATKEDEQIYPCEVQQATLSRETFDINPDLFRDFANYVVQHKINQLLGLQLIDSEESDLVEVEDGAGGTATFHGRDVPDSDHVRITTWVVQKNGGMVSCKGNEGHQIRDTYHKKFIDGKFC